MSCSWDIEDRISNLSYLDYRKNIYKSKGKRHS